VGCALRINVAHVSEPAGKEKKKKKEKKKQDSSAEAPAEWQTFTVDRALRDTEFATWRPTLDDMDLPAKSGQEPWPSGVLRPIAVDYGRSHFLFYGEPDPGALKRLQTLLYPLAAKAEAPSRQERADFLTDLVGPAAGDAWAGECEITSPTRNRVVARVKFELFARWLASVRPEWQAPQIRLVALHAMYLSTQGPLAHLKRMAQQAVPKELQEELKVVIVLSFFRSSPHTSSYSP
jgi:hypothetical protein